MKVYQERAGEPFSSEEELNAKIKDVWKDCATDLKPLQNQKILNSLALDYKQLKKNRNIVSK